MMYHTDDLPDDAIHYRREYKEPQYILRMLEYEIPEYAEKCPYFLAYEDCTPNDISIDVNDSNGDVSGKNCFIATYFYDVFKDDISYIHAKMLEKAAVEPINKQYLLNSHYEVLFDLDRLDIFFHNGSEGGHKSKNVLKENVRSKIKNILYDYLVEEKLIEKCISKRSFYVEALKPEQLVYFKIIRPIKNSLILNLIKFFLHFNIIPIHHFKNEDSLMKFYQIFDTPFINNESSSSRNSLFEKARRKKKPKGLDEPYGLFEDREFSRIFFSTFLTDFYFHKRIKFLDHRLTPDKIIINR